MHKYISPYYLLVILLFGTTTTTFAMNLEQEFQEYREQFLPENVQEPLNIPIASVYNFRKRKPIVITQNDDSHSLDNDSNSLDSEIVITPPIKKPAIQIPANSNSATDSNDDEKLVYYCKAENCSKKYKNLWYLKRHSITHSDDRPFICPQCDNGFKFKHHLTEHLSATHSDARPYSCATCSKDYKRSSELNKHVKNIHAMKCPRREPIQQLPAQSSLPIIPLQ